jgi:hypothetical protein
MKKAFVFSLSVLSLIVLVSSFKNGPANRGHDKTGSPISSGMCMNCHSSGSFSPELHVSMFDGANQVDSYDPGKMYTLRYETTTTGNPSVFGFQTVVLNSSNENAGSFDNVPTGFQLIDLNGADYVEHASPRTSNTFEVSWTAPSDATEEITIYAAGIAANASNNTSGDGGDTSKLVLQPNTSNIQLLSSMSKDLFSLKANLVSNKLITQQSASDSAIKYAIINQNGQLISQVKNVENSLRTEFEISVDDLMPGLYFLHASNGKERHSEKFYKQ